MIDFVFDKSIRDSGNGIKVSVTVVDADPDSNVQINLTSGAFRLPFFLSFYNARLLASCLLQACDAYDAARVEPIQAETETD